MTAAVFAFGLRGPMTVLRASISWASPSVCLSILCTQTHRAQRGPTRAPGHPRLANNGHGITSRALNSGTDCKPESPSWAQSQDTDPKPAGSGQRQNQSRPSVLPSPTRPSPPSSAAPLPLPPSVWTDGRCTPAAGRRPETLHPPADPSHAPGGEPGAKTQNLRARGAAEEETPACNGCVLGKLPLQMRVCPRTRRRTHTHLRTHADAQVVAHVDARTLTRTHAPAATHTRTQDQPCHSTSSGSTRETPGGRMKTGPGRREPILGLRASQPLIIAAPKRTQGP